ncbi:MAG: thiamine pyrophosphate-dependent dehydrogenase E1 component subunit alpha [Actinobacteria bacterium]|nr:thiamine pyrophosphate-dependent dehydrogenase E1 component subunit alpha [Actinomycetota bacterium]
MNKELLVKFLKTMLTIRIFEERVIELFKAGELPGWIHSYLGEEAVAVGVCLNLTKEDYITSTHRGHGHCIAKGVNVKNMMAELYGKETGCCKGRGGSMHITDASVGILGANGIVGGGIPIATGAAFGCKYLNNGRVVVSFFGDGAANQGGFHESLNIASIWKLPVIYVCENNFYAETNPFKKQFNIENIADRSKSYNILGVMVDGMDVIDVYQKVNKVVNDTRNGGGPALVEAKTYRYDGHWVGDPEVYRTREEINEWKKRDPISKLENKLTNEDILTISEIDNIRKEVSAEIEEAVEFARSSPNPLKEDVMDNVYYLQ